ncbi:HDL509Wp [Eremothecium sinecaudum]|uniref:HDL509Wp n=1 Tax=Eremothecium sinecaudum TaxID=45286 RepID=A0A120K230_9SACH|nr:HDL509Wp [Eremothecium sinecaudum]AMD20235.1 HDL509Wp [Eremothecium sinecaudum]
MARKSKLRQRSRKTTLHRPKDALDRKAELVALIESLKAKKLSSSSADAAETAVTRQNATPGPLDAEFSQILAKFAPPPENSTAKDGTLKKSPVPVSLQTYDLQEDSDPEEKQPSKSKTKYQKPSLSELKSVTSHPELIEWYDCDAPDPWFLANIKSAKNIVPVPSHWQTKREYLSGRSLLEKKPFELPDIIKLTNIEDMRNSMPDAGQGDASLKKDARSRVRPRLGKLDLDYSKLHDTFFRLGRNWKPDLLLPYGDQYYENRNLEQEVMWASMRRKYRPGRLSAQIRKALGLYEGRLPSWCKKWKDIGLPPSYPGMKVAGINWDISNAKGDIYGEWRPETKTTDVTRFGQLLSNDSEQSPADANLPTQPTLIGEHVEKNSKSDDQIQTDNTPKDQINIASSEQPDHVTTPTQLYTVLPERKHASQYSSREGYLLPGKRPSPNSSETSSKRAQSIAMAKESDNVEEFKF